MNALLHPGRVAAPEEQTRPKQTCGSCAAFAPGAHSLLGEAPGAGECRAMPPTVVQGGTDEGWGRWPAVWAGSDWCCAWRPKRGGGV